MEAWRNSSFQKLTELDDVPGISFETWLVDFYILNFPPTLNPAQRRHVHDAAIALNLAHLSVGEGKARFIVVSRDPNLLSQILNGDQESTNTNTIEPQSLLGPSRKSSANRWFDDRAVKPKVIAYFQRATEAALAGEQRLLAKIKSYFGLHPELRLRVPAISGTSSSSIRRHAALTTLQNCDRAENHTAALVDSVETLIKMAQHLSTCTEIAFDCEMHHYRSFNGLTCLLQLRGGGRDFIVDTLAVWDSVGPTLGPIFAHPGIVKIGHAIMSGDVPALHRDFGVVIVNGFCTQLAEAALGRDGIGLSALLRSLKCPISDELDEGKEAMKSTDWRLRPLTPEMLRYASLDVHYLIDVYHIQCHRLLAAVDTSTCLDHEDDEDKDLHFDDSPLPPDPVNDEGLWEGWGEVPSPPPAQPSNLQLSSSPTSTAATEQESQSVYGGNDVLGSEFDDGGMLEMTCALDGEEYPESEPDDVPPSRTILRELTVKVLVNDVRCDRLYRCLIEMTAQMCKRLWEPKLYSENAFRKEQGYKARMKAKDEFSVFVYQRLHRWRMEEAQRCDESLHYICPTHDLFLVAEHKPTTNTALLTLFKPQSLPLSLQDVALHMQETETVGIIQSVKMAVTNWNEMQEEMLALRLAHTATVAKLDLRAEGAAADSVPSEPAPSPIVQQSSKTEFRYGARYILASGVAAALLIATKSILSHMQHQS